MPKTLSFIILLASLVTACRPTPRLILATTTSAYDSGLLDALIPPFGAANHVRVEVVAVGSGQALALAQRGDADVVLTHDREREEEFLAGGYGVDAREVMYGDYIILGPPEDPAGIRGMNRAADALAKVFQAKVAFISRGDGSGTHAKETELWKKVSLDPSPDLGWYISAGQGMGEALTLADERQAYTLADRATYLARQEGLSLFILVEGDEALFNPYRVIAVNPARHPQAKYDLAMRFMDYLTSYQTQKLISEFGREKYGQPLFFPNSQEWRVGEG